MSKETEAFLSQGVLKYATASDAVALFRDEMQERLQGILSQKNDWKLFVKSGSSDALGGGAGGPGGASGRWIFSYVKGTVPAVSERVSVCIGLWWSPPRSVGHEVILYAHYGEVDALKFHPYQSATPGVSAAPKKMGVVTRLFMAPRPDLEFDRDFGLLLTELERHGGTCGCVKEVL